MSKDHNVISIASLSNGRQPAGPVQPGRLHAPLNAVRDRALTFLRVGLSEVFDNLDDTLFEKADRAGNNADQSMFFDAMRVLRLQRHAVEKRCCDGLDVQFSQLQYGRNTVADAPASYDIDSLSLVQPDELEQTVALDGMTGRVSAHNQIGLTHLALRFNHLVSINVTDANNPLAPAQLVQLFADSYAPLNLDIKVRLIILKMFERHVLNSIGSLYGDINELLANAGILPGLKHGAAPQQRPRASAATAPARDSAAPGAPAGGQPEEQVLALFSDLISSWRHTSGDIALSALGAPSAPPVRSEELLGMLNRFTAPGADEAATLSDLRGHISRQLSEQQQQTGEVRKLDRVDDDVISLVSMLFDVVLDDDELPVALKALVARMQLPILRIAIADKSLFSRSSHPARRLLNELARATMGWSDHDDLQRDQLHSLLERMVDRMLCEERADAAFFEQMREELAGFVLLEQRRSERMEQRTRDAEEGRARVEAARSQAARVLNELLLGRTLPVLAVDLLRDRWSQVLQLAYLREGEQSSAWQEAVVVAGQVVRSVEAPVDETLEQRQAFNLTVCESVCDGLRLIGEDAPQDSSWVRQLQALQASVLAPLAEPEPEPEPLLLMDVEHDAGLALPELATAVPSVVEYPDEGEADELQAPALSAEPVLSVLSVPPEQPEQPEMVLIEAPVLDEPVAQASAETVEDLPDVDAAEWVENLHAGSWFELCAAEGRSAQRCKLAAIISFSGKYIFVNRTGMKVAEFNRLELAREYGAGGIRLLANDQLFDRALESVIGNLRELRDSRG